jgi:hypothetical protein
MEIKNPLFKVVGCAALLVVGFFSGSAIAQATKPAPSLIGSWVGSQNGMPTTTTFMPNGTYTTRVEMGAGRLTMEGPFKTAEGKVEMQAKTVEGNGLPQAAIEAVKSQVSKSHTAEVKFLNPDKVVFTMQGQSAEYSRLK